MSNQGINDGDPINELNKTYQDHMAKYNAADIANTTKEFFDRAMLDKMEKQLELPSLRETLDKLDNMNVSSPTFTGVMNPGAYVKLGKWNNENEEWTKHKKAIFKKKTKAFHKLAKVFITNHEGWIIRPDPKDPLSRIELVNTSGNKGFCLSEGGDEILAVETDDRDTVAYSTYQWYEFTNMAFGGALPKELR